MCKPKKPKAPAAPPPPEYLRNPLLDADRNLNFMRQGRSSLRISRGGPLVPNGGRPAPALSAPAAAPRSFSNAGFLGGALNPGRLIQSIAGIPGP